MSSKKPNIFDKLTDPKLYTGAHKERFDKDGKGKGLAGRTDNTAPKDLKNMVDSKSGTTTINSSNNKEVKSSKNLENTTKKLNNMNINSNEKKEQNKSKTNQPSIFDKLTDPKLYTGAHKERFDEDGKGKGLAGRTDNTAPKDLKNMVDTKSGTTLTNNNKAPSNNNINKTNVAKSDKVVTKPTDNKNNSSKKQNIFDKLTDPKLYTGAHKERFDKDGKGKGLAGRTDNTAPKDLKNMVDSK